MVTYGEGVRHPTTHVQGQSFVLIEPLFLEIGSKNMILALTFEALHAWGFKVWLLNGFSSDLCFPKAFKQSTKFPRQKSGDMSPYFRSGN